MRDPQLSLDELRGPLLHVGMIAGETVKDYVLSLIQRGGDIEACTASVVQEAGMSWDEAEGIVRKWHVHGSDADPKGV